MVHDTEMILGNCAIVAKQRREIYDDRLERERKNAL